MKSSLFAMTCLLLAASSAYAEPHGWKVAISAGRQTLTYDGFAKNGVTYKFTCDAKTLEATEIGVTRLMNMADGQKIGDTSGSIMPPGAAVMTLFTDRTEPAFVAADAKPNETSGWDLTIRLPLSNASVRAFPRAKAVSLMTSGWTGLAEISQGDRETIAGFLKSCETGP